MIINPIGISIKQLDKNSTGDKDFTPVTKRYNSLQDIEFDIIADKIRCQNLRNQMDIRLTQLKKKLNRCAAQNLYSS